MKTSGIWFPVRLPIHSWRDFYKMANVDKKGRKSCPEGLCAGDKGKTSQLHPGSGDNATIVRLLRSRGDPLRLSDRSPLCSRLKYPSSSGMDDNKSDGNTYQMEYRDFTAEKGGKKGP